MSATLPGPWHSVHCSPIPSAVLRGAYSEPPLVAMCDIASEVSWHAKQAVAIGEFTSEAGLAATLVPAATEYSVPSGVHADDALRPGLKLKPMP